MARIGRYLNIFGLIAIGLGITIGVRYLITSDNKPATVNPEIGGPFQLVDHNGMKVTEKDYLGAPFLVYFGYTFCPDVCPTSLSTIGDALEILGDDGKDIKTLFISVDTERDTPEVLKTYVSYFHPSVVGLSGAAEQLAAAATGYRAFYAKTLEEGANEGDYLMDHSAFIYLMGADGVFVRMFGHGVSAEDLASSIRDHL